MKFQRMSYREPDYYGQESRGAEHQARLRRAAAAREMVKEAYDTDYNNAGKKRSAIGRMLARRGRRHGGWK